MEIRTREILIWFTALVFAGFIAVGISSSSMAGIFLESKSKGFLAVLVMLSSVVFVVVTSVKNHYQIAKFVYLGLSLRLIVLIAIAFFNILPYSFDVAWDEYSEILLPNWQRGDFGYSFPMSGNVKYYTYLATSVYYIFGSNPVFMMLLNVLWGTLSIILIYRIGSELFNEKSGKLAAFILAFWPSHILFSAMNMRDSLATILILALLLNLIKWIKYSKGSSLFLVVVLLIGNIMIRQQNAALLGGTVLPLIVLFAIKRAHPLLKPIWVIAGFGGLLGLFGVAWKLGYLSALDISYVIREMNYRTDGGSAYLTSMQYSSWLDIIIYAPVRLIFFLFTPFLWQAYNLQQALSAVESLILMFFSAVVIKNIRLLRGVSKNKLAMTAFILICFIGLLANSIIDSNTGTAVRHKLQFLCMVFVLYSYIKTKKKESTTERI
ncbi:MULTISPECIES: glycosyltransferase family 39 protein [unclassified Paenibacillus]|uniref:glycosyltransferase family 39 protein n=1 Tax=unclassified Paenibacillus TaxID=185978 RepID=UPI002405260A|nr:MULTISPECIES: glycosyltransferase family 39 protein [unclassified Paenibacillus]MDF9845164.1 4-amino-4-deoxy-L-arabinose transferase-like glycosyltransferase [Paenibacillus sp. PastF-2]MDF9850344.1 4-amino-4-deoxy-L-arabinose transferase-like glycosyltransferase [Paenibacillus sp. PastM-2]MDF9856953.1 4-amino-4-deoxy-L-arabinose transferase-like glycosyltransferase [Paenibacillus sp. PastF-1]MDH6482190.1 4-amino-4-deoxy-L-arabinose transferase-like glycosyltransferase [Paenibacillus sp. Past